MSGYSAAIAFLSFFRYLAHHLMRTFTPYMNPNMLQIPYYCVYKRMCNIFYTPYIFQDIWFT